MKALIKPTVLSKRVEDLEFTLNSDASMLYVYVNGKQFSLGLHRGEGANWFIVDSPYHLDRWHAHAGEFSIHLSHRTYLERRFDWLTTLWLNTCELEEVYQRYLIDEEIRQQRHK